MEGGEKWATWWGRKKKGKKKKKHHCQKSGDRQKPI